MENDPEFTRLILNVVARLYCRTISRPKIGRLIISVENRKDCRALVRLRQRVPKGPLK